MPIYRVLTKRPYPRSYFGKLVLLCLTGALLPVLALSLYAVLAMPLDDAIIRLIVPALLMAFVGAGLTATLVRGLLQPMFVTQKALSAYVENGTRLSLPTGGHDEAGSLMANVQHVVDHLERTLMVAKQQALNDPLTGLGNRRWLVKESDRAFGLMRRSGAPLSVITFDIDHFKALNDRHGHDAGDEVLRAVAASVRGQLRSYDLFARTGGEEFCIVLPNTDRRQTGNIAERLRAHLHNLRRANDESSEVTASFGVASATPTTITLSQVLIQADNALTAAKGNGRDRVSVASDPSTDVIAA